MRSSAYQNGLAQLGVTSQEGAVAPSGTQASMTDADSGFAPGFPDGFRLEGIDAPETAHASNNFSAEPMAYAARDELARITENAGGARLEATGENEFYGRGLAKLLGEDGTNIGAELARTGLVNMPRHAAPKEYQDAFRGANWRTMTDAGDILTGDAAEVNKRVRALQQEVFAARQRGELSPILKPDYDKNQMYSAWDKSWTRGVHNAVGSLNMFGAAIGDVFGIDAWKQWGEEGARERLQKAAAFPAEVQDWDDVHTLDAFGTFALEKLGENLPQLGIDAAAMLGTGGAATAARLGFAKTLSRELSAGQLADFGIKAGKAGAMGAIYGQVSGETALDLYQAGVDDYGSTALLAGVPKAALEYTPLGYALRNFAKVSGMPGAKIWNAATQVAKTAGVEATTEGMQTIVDFMARKHHTGEDLFSDDNIRELKTAVASGAIIGGGFASVATVPPAYKALRDKYFPKQNDSTQSIQKTTDGTPITTREGNSDIRAQLNRFADGEKPAVFISSADKDMYPLARAANPTAQMLETEEGLLLLSNPIDEEQYRQANPKMREAMRAYALGYTQTKNDVQLDKAQVVQTRDDAGNIIHQEITDRPAEVVQKQEAAARPTDMVEQRPLVEVIQEREAKANAEQSNNDAPRNDVVESQQLLPDEILDGATAVSGGMDQQLPGPAGSVTGTGEPGASPQSRAGRREIFLGSHGRESPTSGDTTTGTAGGIPVQHVAPLSTGSGTGRQPDATSDGSGATSVAADTERDRIISEILSGDSGAGETSVRTSTGTAAPVDVDGTGDRGVGTTLTGTGEGARETVRASDAPGSGDDSRRAGVREGAGETSGRIDITSIPRVSDIFVKENLQAAIRLLSQPDLLNFFNQLQQQGVSTGDALAYTFARWQLLQNPAVDTQDSADAPELIDEVAPVTETSDVDAPDLLEQNDAETQASVHESVYQPDDLDAEPNPADYRGEFFDRALHDKIAAFKALYPTWAVTPVALPKRPGGKLSRTRSILQVQKLQWNTQKEAQVYALSLEAEYAGQIFNIHENAGKFELTRHLLTAGHSTSSEATPESTWVRTSLPKIIANGGAASRIVDAAEKAIRSSELSQEASISAFKRIEDNSARLLVAEGLDPVTGAHSKHLRLHAPSITELGRSLVGPAQDRGMLEYYYDAFSAGIAALYSQGYVINTPLDHLSPTIFTPTAEQYTIAQVFELRKGRAGQEKVLQKLEGQHRKALADLRTLENKVNNIQFQKGAFHDNALLDLQAQKGVVAGLELALADMRAALADRRVDQTNADELRADFAGTADEVNADGNTDFDPRDFIDREGRESVEEQQLRAEMEWRNTPREYDEFGESTRVSRSAVKHTGQFKQPRIYNRKQVSDAAINATVRSFISRFPGLSSVKVVVSPTQGSLSSGFTKALYAPDTDTLTIFSKNVDSTEDVLRSLQHELFVHKGLGFFTAAEQQQIFDMLRAAVQTNSDLAAVYADIQSTYPDISAQQQLEELLAFVAEHLQTSKERGWSRIRSAVRNFLKQFGLVSDTPTIADVESVLYMITDALAAGDRPEIRNDAPAMERRAIISALGRFGSERKLPLMQAARAFGSGIKKLTQPLMTGLYQLNDISPDAAEGFKKYWAERDSARAVWEGMAQNQLGLDNGAFNKAWRELVNFGETEDLTGASPEALRLRKFIDLFYDKYAKPNLPTLGKVPNYVPQVYDVIQFTQREGEVLDILMRFLPAQENGQPSEIARAIVRSIVAKGGSYEHTLEDYQGVVAPGTDHRHARILRNPELIAALDDAGFMFTDKQAALDHYLTTTINRAAFEKTFSGMRVVPGWINAKGHYNRELLMNLFESAGRDDLLTSDMPTRDLFNLAVDQGYADVVKPQRLNGTTVGYVFNHMHPSVGYQYLSYHAWKADRPDLVPPMAEVHNTKKLFSVLAALQAENIRVPMQIHKFTTKEQLLWYSPTFDLHKMRSDLDPTARRRMDEIVHGFMGFFGARVSPTVHRWQSNIMAYESVLTLAFSTLSSLPDFAGGFLRVMQQSGVKEALRALRTAMSETGKANSIQFARELGMLNHRQTAAALKAMWGQDHYSPHAQKVLDGLFKYNGQELLTQMSRVFTTQVGVKYFSQLAADNDAASLQAFGITPEQVHAWQELGMPTYTLDTADRGGVEAVIAQRMHSALHRFVDQSVLRPNAGQRPVWANDPRFALFWHLKSFLWAYWSVIVAPTGRSIINQIKQGQYGEATAQLAFFGLMILPLAALGWEIRQLIQYSLFDEEQPNDRLDGFDYSMELLQRSGVAGPFQLAFDALEQDSADKAAIRLAGPTMDHAWTLLHGDWDKKFYRSTPLVGQLYGAQPGISDYASQLVSDNPVY
jgi:Staphylococcal nuclease homologue